MCFGDLGPQGGRCYFLLAQKVTKDALGDAFGAHPACGGAHRRLAPKPPFYERGPLRLGSSFRRAKSRSVSVLFSAHWGLMPSKLQVITFYRTPPGASLPVWCGSRRADARNCPAATVMPGQAVKFQRRMPQISAWAGPSGPRQEGRKVLFSEPPDASAYLPGWRPPVMGVWGWGDLERPPAARRSSETHPQSLFGSFLVIQKGTRPAGRNPA